MVVNIRRIMAAPPVLHPWRERTPWVRRAPQGGMMEGEGEHGGGSRRSPFFSQLLTAPTLDAEARRKLAAQADARIVMGLATITEATAAGTHAATATARLDAARRLREGVDQFRSGAAAQAALNGAQPPEETATWNRWDTMNLCAGSGCLPRIFCSCCSWGL
jgi:hypothetical protein